MRPAACQCRSLYWISCHETSKRSATVKIIQKGQCTYSSAHSTLKLQQWTFYTRTRSQELLSGGSSNHLKLTRNFCRIFGSRASLVKISNRVISIPNPFPKEYTLVVQQDRLTLMTKKFQRKHQNHTEGWKPALQQEVGRITFVLSAEHTLVWGATE